MNFLNTAVAALLSLPIVGCASIPSPAPCSMPQEQFVEGSKPTGTLFIRKYDFSDFDANKDRLDFMSFRGVPSDIHNQVSSLGTIKKQSCHQARVSISSDISDGAGVEVFNYVEMDGNDKNVSAATINKHSFSTRALSNGREFAVKMNLIEKSSSSLREITMTAPLSSGETRVLSISAHHDDRTTEATVTTITFFESGE